MNINYLREILTRNGEIKLIGKTVTIDGVICNVMGIVRQGTDMNLLILQYDENYELMIEEMDAAEMNEPPVMTETNRTMLNSSRKIEAINPFQTVLKVIIDDKEFEVHSSEHRRLSTEDWEVILLIINFLDKGLQPSGIDYKRFNALFLTSLKLDGDYNSIPDFIENSEIRFSMGPYSISHQVEMPVTLIVDGKYKEKLIFHDAITGVEHWAQINRVYLSDMWEEMDKILTDPKLHEYMAPEEIAKVKLNFEKHFAEICQRGMCFPVIEYECEKEISLQFYSRTFLDAKPVHKNSGMGFIIKPDQPSGILGFKLKAAVIQDPVPPNTRKIEAELFQYIRTVTNDDIILK